MATPQTAPVVTLTPVTRAYFSVLRGLASTIWRQHYAAIISAVQIDYMLASRFSEKALREQIATPNKWLELLRAGCEPVGYCGYELIREDDASPSVMKLGQLYVLESHRGLGLGRVMLGRVEVQAREHGSRTIHLQVNKRNTSSIGFYQAMGFEVFCEAVFDIGGGFVMDDFLMEKRL